MQFVGELAHDAVWAASLSACLYLFISVKQDVFSIHRQVRDKLSWLESERLRADVQIQTIEQRLEKNERRIDGNEERLDLLSPGRRETYSPIDANRRSQVIRLSKRGDTTEKIAAALQVPKNEVELLLKVHRSVVRAF